MSQWAEIKQRVADKWQIPLLCVSILLLIGAFLRVRPTPERLPVDQAVAYLQSLVDAELLPEAAQFGGALLSREDLDTVALAPVHLQMARARHGMAKAEDDRSADSARQIQQHFELARKHGAQLTGEDLRAMGDSFYWQESWQAAIGNYRRAIDAGVSGASDLRQTVYAVSLAAGADLEDLYRQLEELLSTLESHRLDLLAWALEQSLHILDELDRLSEGSTLVVTHQSALRNSEFADDYDYLTALLFAKQRKFDEAERLLRTVQNRADLHGPVHAKAGWLLGTVVMNDGHPQRPYESLAFFRNVISDHPKSPYAVGSRVGAAQSLALIERHDKALHEYRLAVEEIFASDPADLRFIVDIAGVRAQIGVTAQRLQSQGTLIKAAQYAALAVELIDAGNEEQEAAFLQQLAELQEAVGEWLLRESEHVAQSDAARAGQLADRSREFLARAAESFLNISRIQSINEERGAESIWHAAGLFHGAGMLQRAVELYETFAAERPGHPLVARAMLRTGQTYQQLGRIPEAISAFQACFRQFPRTIDGAAALVPLARCYLLGGNERLPLAERTLHIVLVESDIFTPAAPEFADALFLLGEVQIRRENYEDAIASLEEALDRYPDDPRNLLAQSMLADAYRHSGLALKTEAKSVRGGAKLQYLSEESTRRLTRARQLYRRVVDAYASSPLDTLSDVERLDRRLAHAYEADCFYETGAFAQALARYQAVAGLFKDSTTALSAYVQIINCHIFLGQHDEAASALARAMVLVDTVPEDAFTQSVSPEGRADWKRYFDWLESTELF